MGANHTGYMGATVEWHPLIQAVIMFAYSLGAFLVLAGLTWWAWIRYWQRWRVRVRCRRYFKEHPYYVAEHWQPRPRRRAR